MQRHMATAGGVVSCSTTARFMAACMGVLHGRERTVASGQRLAMHASKPSCHRRDGWT